jgi:hypothetical protein
MNKIENKFKSAPWYNNKRVMNKIKNRSESAKWHGDKKAVDDVKEISEKVKLYGDESAVNEIKNISERAKWHADKSVVNEIRKIFESVVQEIEKKSESAERLSYEGVMNKVEDRSESASEQRDLLIENEHDLLIENAYNLLIDKVGECLKIANLNTSIADNQPVKDYINSFIDNLDLEYDGDTLAYNSISDEGPLKGKWKQDVHGSGTDCLIRALLVAAGCEMGKAYSNDRINFECIVRYVRIGCDKLDEHAMSGEERVIATLRNLTINGEYVIKPERAIQVYKVEQEKSHNPVRIYSAINQHAGEEYAITREGKGKYRAVIGDDVIASIPDGRWADENFKE